MTLSTTGTLPPRTLEPVSLPAPKPIALMEMAPGPSTSRRHGSDDNSNEATQAGHDDGPPLHTAPVHALEKWNDPKGNVFRIAAVYWSLFVSGANDAAYGALIPYLETYYDLSYLVVSLIFLAPFVGFIVSAATNNWLHLKVGQRWIAFICGASHAICYLMLSQHPPYPVLVFAYVIAGLGNGIGLAAWNSFIGNLARSNELLGFMHASYGAGATVSPLIATTMITRGGLEWHAFYYVLVSLLFLFNFENKESVWLTKGIRDSWAWQFWRLLSLPGRSGPRRLRTTVTPSL